MPWGKTVFCRRLELLLSAAALLHGCATEPVTTLEMTCMIAQIRREPFKKLLIISVASSDFVQIAFQDPLAAALKSRGMSAVASKRYFSSGPDAEKARFRQSIGGSGADFVLIAHVPGRDTK